MTASILLTRKIRLTQLETLSKLTITALVGCVLLIGYAMMIMAGRLDWRGIAFIAITLLLARIIALGGRWAPLLGSILSGLLLIDNAPAFAYALAHVNNLRTLAFQVLFMAVLVVGMMAGIGATVQNYRGVSPVATRWLLVGLAVLATTGVTIILLTTRQSVAADPNADPSATLPVLTTANFAFDQTEIRTKVGEAVALPLINRDPYAHSLDVDEFDVHVLMLTGEPSVARFTPTQPGTYTFYCGVPGHRQGGMVGTLIVEP